jgi:RNA polymerase sigma-B factor
MKPCDLGRGEGPVGQEGKVETHLLLFEKLPCPHARTQLVGIYRPLAIELAQRYSHRGQDLEDLIQVSLLGLLNAIDRFDPQLGHRFVSFAVPTITGELKRFFRDTGWSVGVPRRMKEVSIAARSANEELCQRLGRSPSVDEIARHIGSSIEEVAESATLTSAYRAHSLDDNHEEGRTAEIDLLGEVDPRIELFEELDALEPILQARSEREREILFLRFYVGMTQREIAEEVGMSQMNVSRVLSSSLEKLRVLLTA